MIRFATLASLMALSALAVAAPEKYTIDSAHTYPAFEADHMGGLSLWRGKFNGTQGSVTLDVAGKTGTVDITVDTASLDFGHDKMNDHARSPDLFDVAKYPAATYRGTISKWNGDAPAEVDGQLTIKGVSKPVKLAINAFLCKQNPMNRKMMCGADASASINRDDFGLDYGKAFGFKMATKLLISIEAVKAD
jgi:polyisoprenoid-binding protein YceI